MAIASEDGTSSGSGDSVKRACGSHGVLERRADVTHAKGACRKILLFGRMPAHGEVGGVITFTHNLSKENRDLIDAVVDFYPSDEKVLPDDVQVEEVTGNFLIRVLKLLLMHFQSNTLFHHNFSTVRGLLPFVLFPKLKGSKWMLTLHHGELANCYDSLSVTSKAIVRFCLRRFDTICSLSAKQDAFFAAFTEKALPRVSPFVQPTERDRDSCEHDSAPADSEPVFLIAGYPTRIYRHLETIKTFRELWEKGSRFRLKVCLYGSDTDGIRGEIVDAVRQCPFAELHADLDSASFQRELRCSDFYVRMNTIDSYGLVCAEAAQHGLTTIATNVCSRYPGTLLIERDDFPLLKQALLLVLAGDDPSSLLHVEAAEQEIVSFRSLYQGYLETRAA